MFSEYNRIAQELNQRVYSFPMPPALVELTKSREVQEYFQNYYKRQLVLDVVGNIKLNPKFTDEQILSLEKNIDSPAGIELLVNHFIFSLGNSTPDTLNNK